MSRVSFVWECSCLAALRSAWPGRRRPRPTRPSPCPAPFRTAAAAIDSKGAVTGSYTDSHGKVHGFVRTPDGTITSFDPQGSSLTEPSGIDKNGTIAGTWTDSGLGDATASCAAPDGTITSFDPANSTDTTAASIHGKIVGSFHVGAEIRGYLRSHGGHFRKFHIPQSDTITPTDINGVETVTGDYLDRHQVMHGFIRNPDGSFVTFDPTGATSTAPTGINRAGIVTGRYEQLGAIMDSCAWRTGRSRPSTSAGALATMPAGINTKGVIAGSYTDADQIVRGFVRDTDGTLTLVGRARCAEHRAGRDQQQGRDHGHLRERGRHRREFCAGSRELVSSPLAGQNQVISN